MKAYVALCLLDVQLPVCVSRFRSHVYFYVVHVELKRARIYVAGVVRLVITVFVKVIIYQLVICEQIKTSHQPLAVIIML